MEDKRTIWIVLAVAGFIALLLLPPYSTPPRKARAQHVTGLNTVGSASFTTTNASALPSGQPGTGK